MDKQEILDRLNKNPFFEPFSDQEKGQLAALTSNVIRFQDQDYIIHEGDADTSIFILLEGTVSVTKKRDPCVELNTLKEGSVFGDIAFVSKKPRHTNVVAMGEVTVLKLEDADLVRGDPALISKFKDQFILVLSQRLEEMNQAMLEVKAQLDRFQIYEIIDEGEEGVFEEEDGGEIRSVPHFLDDFFKTVRP